MLTLNLVYVGLNLIDSELKKIIRAQKSSFSKKKNFMFHRVETFLQKYLCEI